jgi:hypothetical protein
LPEEELEEFCRQKQIDRTVARAMGAMKRRAAKAPKVKLPKVPKPRKHIKHCYCLPVGLESQLCCRCKGEKCLKVKKPKRPKAIA